MALSTPEVTINSNFTGTTVTVFGVIDRDARSVSGVGGYDIAVLLLGPRETVVARRKERILGIWANAAAQTFEAAPSFYGLSTSVKVEDLATQPVLQRLQLGFDNIAFRYQGLPLTNDPAAGSFREAFIRLKERAGLYRQEVGLNFIGNLIFRTTFHLPANIPVGAYTADAYLFSDRLLIARADDRAQCHQNRPRRHHVRLRPQPVAVLRPHLRRACPCHRMDRRRHLQTGLERPQAPQNPDGPKRVRRRSSAAGRRRGGKTWCGPGRSNCAPAHHPSSAGSDAWGSRHCRRSELQTRHCVVSVSRLSVPNFSAASDQASSPIGVSMILPSRYSG